MSRLRDVLWYPTREEFDRQEDILRNSSEADKKEILDNRQKNNRISSLATRTSFTMMSFAGYFLFGLYHYGNFDATNPDSLDLLMMSTLSAYAIPLTWLGMYYGIGALGDKIFNNVKSLDNKLEKQNE